MRVSSYRYGTRAAIAGCALVLFLVLALGGRAAATGRTAVVGPTGTVGGHGYSYWLMRSWQRVFSTSAPVNPCQTLTAGDDRVAYLTLKTIAPGVDNYSCDEPAGRPIYAVGLSNECSTWEGDHGGFGTSNDQLVLCARELFAGAKQKTTFDGLSVKINDLISATRAFHVRAARDNILGLTPGDGRSAAYGFGLLLRGLDRGTHVIHTEASIGTASWSITFTLHVH